MNIEELKNKIFFHPEKWQLHRTTSDNKNNIVREFKFCFCTIIAVTDSLDSKVLATRVVTDEDPIDIDVLKTILTNSNFEEINPEIKYAGNLFIPRFKFYCACCGKDNDCWVDLRVWDSWEDICNKHIEECVYFRTNQEGGLDFEFPFAKDINNDFEHLYAMTNNNGIGMTVECNCIEDEVTEVCCFDGKIFINDFEIFNKIGQDILSGKIKIQSNQN
jgi:hypothetical protein